MMGQSIIVLVYKILLTTNINGLLYISHVLARALHSYKDSV